MCYYRKNILFGKGKKSQNYILGFQILDIEAKIVICTAQTAEKVLKAVKYAERILKHKVKVFSFGPLENVKGSEDEDLIELAKETDINDAPEPVIFDDNELDTETAIVFWTSGTTGMKTVLVLKMILLILF